jgi:RNA polymerase sigma factor (TIGR02999 family)
MSISKARTEEENGNALSEIRSASEMRSTGSAGVTDLLLAWKEGDATAMDRLAPLVYQELHRLARGYMKREREAHSLQTSALVNEAYLRLVDVRRVDWQNRAHFFAMASRLMRRILVDFARRRRYQKRGGNATYVTFDESLTVSPGPSTDLVAIDDALTALASVDPRKVRVVELRFFAGLDVRETAEALSVSPETVRRDWRLAKAWLRRELRKH